MADGEPSVEDRAQARVLLSRRGFPVEALPEVLAQALAEAREAGVRAAIAARQALVDDDLCGCGSCVLEAVGLPRMDGR